VPAASLDAAPPPHADSSAKPAMAAVAIIRCFVFMKLFPSLQIFQYVFLCEFETHAR
jgi:hypothetical protein